MNKRTVIVVFLGMTLIPLVEATIITGGTPNARWEVKEYLYQTKAEQYVYRIDLANYDHKYYSGYAWYKPRRITLYKNAWNTTLFHPILAHEVGHLYCETKELNKFNSQHNENCADSFVLRNQQ